VSGSRKVIIDPNTYDGGFYSGKRFRIDIHNSFKGIGLRHGETVFYEIVGFADDGSRIMPAHKVSDKKLKKRFGPIMVYKYGQHDASSYNVLVYRITNTDLEGNTFELPYLQMIARCKDLGLSPVPHLMSFVQTLDSGEGVLELAKELSEGVSTLDSEHIREGVCVRVESQYQTAVAIYKQKSFHFKVMEGIAKDSDVYVDPEEVESFGEIEEE